MVSLFLFAIVLLISLFSSSVLSFGNQPVGYPESRRTKKRFSYPSKVHGTVFVADPYNEYETTDSNETKTFYSAQNTLTQQYVDNCPDHGKVRQSLQSAWTFDKFGTPQAEGPYDNLTYYYQVNVGGSDAQWTWYTASHEELLAAEKVNYEQPAGRKFFNANLLSNDGSVFLAGLFVSPSGGTVAYTVSAPGSNTNSVYFRSSSRPFVDQASDAKEAAKGGPDRLLDELLDVASSDVQWSADSKGVFYQTYIDDGNDQQGVGTRVHYHVIGTKQQDDILVVDRDPNATTTFWGMQPLEDGKWLLLNAFDGASQQMRVFVAPLVDQPISEKMKWLSFEPQLHDYYTGYVSNDDNAFYMITNKDAPNWKIVRATLDVSKSQYVKHVMELKDQVDFEDVIPEDKTALLDDAVVVGGTHVLAWYIKDVNNELYHFDLRTGTKVQRLLPDFIGQIFAVKARMLQPEAFLSVMSFTTPFTIYRLTWPDDAGPITQPSVVVHRTTRMSNSDLATLNVRRVYIPGEGGFQIPVYLIYCSHTSLDGTAPALLYAYGAKEDRLLPAFDASFAWWINAYAGVLVWVSARADPLFSKKNTFADILAAGQYMIDEKLAAHGKVIAWGDGAGGTSMLAVCNMANASLLGAVFANNPMTDLLRLKHLAGGAEWLGEFGDVTLDPDIFDYVQTYSPLHSVDAGKAYPMMLITAAEKDEAVSPAHSYKMIAQLQYALSSNANPLLLRVIPNAGHADDVAIRINEDSIKFSLSAQALALPRKA